MARWPWTDRAFTFDFPVSKAPDILERLRGTPARIEETVRGQPPAVLTARDGRGWSMQENIGHLLDVEGIWLRRVEEALSGATEFCPADITNQQTHAANHNAQQIGALLQAFRAARGRLVARLEGLDDDGWAQASLHPRLRQTMRVVDLACFVAEHDDYHLARVRELIRGLPDPR